jgi:hypothetical protein
MFILKPSRLLSDAVAPSVAFTSTGTVLYDVTFLYPIERLHLT